MTMSLGDSETTDSFWGHDCQHCGAPFCNHFSNARLTMTTFSGPHCSAPHVLLPLGWESGASSSFFSYRFQLGSAFDILHNAFSGYLQQIWLCDELFTFCVIRLLSVTKLLVFLFGVDFELISWHRPEVLMLKGFSKSLWQVETVWK